MAWQNYRMRRRALIHTTSGAGAHQDGLELAGAILILKVLQEFLEFVCQVTGNADNVNLARPP